MKLNILYIFLNVCKLTFLDFTLNTRVTPGKKLLYINIEQKQPIQEERYI